jgi:hypothetical protein
LRKILARKNFLERDETMTAVLLRILNTCTAHATHGC